MLKLDCADRIARLTLDRPPVNAINADWLEAFGRILDGLAQRHDWHVLHIRSGRKVFCAGADLAEMRGRFDAADGVDAMIEAAASMQKLFARIEALPQVTFAEIGGAALGGGMELALACDLRIAATEAKLGLPEARLGLIPGAGGTQRMTRLAGTATAARMILTCEIADGATAHALGLVQWSVPGSELASRAAQIASDLAALPAAALAACKSCITAANDPSRDGYAEELAASRQLYANTATRQRVAVFLADAARPKNIDKERT